MGITSIVKQRNAYTLPLKIRKQQTKYIYGFMFSNLTKKHNKIFLTLGGGGDRVPTLR